MEKIVIKPLGKMEAQKGRWIIRLASEYKSAIIGLEGFSHLQVFFWFHRHDTAESRKILTCDKPYKKGPNKLGVFATRSEYRPNLIGLSALAVKSINSEKA